MPVPDQSTKATVMAWLSPAWVEYLLKRGLATRDDNSSVVYVRGRPDERRVSNAG